MPAARGQQARRESVWRPPGAAHVRAGAGLARKPVNPPEGMLDDCAGHSWRTAWRWRALWTLSTRYFHAVEQDSGTSRFPATSCGWFAPTSMTSGYITPVEREEKGGPSSAAFRRARCWDGSRGSSRTTRYCVAHCLRARSWCATRTTLWSWSEVADFTRRCGSAKSQRPARHGLCAYRAWGYPLQSRKLSDSSTRTGEGLLPPAWA